jgi:hypothetical protein
METVISRLESHANRIERSGAKIRASNKNHPTFASRNNAKMMAKIMANI